MLKEPELHRSGGNDLKLGWEGARRSKKRVLEETIVSAVGTPFAHVHLATALPNAGQRRGKKYVRKPILESEGCITSQPPTRGTCQLQVHVLNRSKPPGLGNVRPTSVQVYLGMGGLPSVI